ncbi:hypothetical protein PEX1_094250 [Penicillium expansum]|nr:hypothetical protein PEX1_094250 [Penicillium expansum]
MVRLGDLYRKLAKIVLSLSTLTLSKIGSVERDPKNMTWKVLNRPLSYSMNEVVQLGTLARSIIPNSMYSEASSYYDALVELQISHLIKNILVNEAKNIVGVVDWEFTYTAPVEFSHAPPWWLLLEKPEYWSKGLGDWCSQYDKRLETFLQAMNDCEDESIRAGQLMETQRLSGLMRDSWKSGNFWVMYAARNNFAFDSIYWRKIDRRFFGPTQSFELDNVWKERLHLLTLKEKEYINICVKLRFEQMNTRPLAWDPDEYTRAYECEWVE